MPRSARISTSSRSCSVSSSSLLLGEDAGDVAGQLARGARQPLAEALEPAEFWRFGSRRATGSAFCSTVFVTVTLPEAAGADCLEHGRGGSASPSISKDAAAEQRSGRIPGGRDAAGLPAESRRRRLVLRRRSGGTSTGAGAGVSGWAGEGGTSCGRSGSGCGGTSGGWRRRNPRRGGRRRFRWARRVSGGGAGGCLGRRRRLDGRRAAAGCCSALVLPNEKTFLMNPSAILFQAARSRASAAGTAVSRSPSWPVMIGLDDLARLAGTERGQRETFGAAEPVALDQDRLRVPASEARCLA